MIKNQAELKIIISVFLLALEGCAGRQLDQNSWSIPDAVVNPGAVVNTECGQTHAAPPEYGTGHGGVAPLEIMVSKDTVVLVACALENNMAIKAAQAQLDEAKAHKRAVDAGKMPKLNLNAQATGVRTGNENSSLPSSTSQAFRGAVDLGIPLDLFGRIATGQAVAAYQETQARENLENTRLSVMRDVFLGVIDAAEQSQLHTLNHQQLETSRTSYKLTALRYTKGQANIVDVLQQRDLVKSLEQETPALIAARQKALDGLAVLTGRLAGYVEHKGYNILPMTAQTSVTVQPVELLGSRPDMRALKAGLDVADGRLSIAIKDRLPSFEFSGSAVATLLSGDISSVISGTVSAALTLFDGGAKRAEIDVRRAIFTQAGTAYIEGWLRAVAEVNGLIAEEKRRGQEHGLAEARLENARKLHKAVQRRYRLGASDYLPVLTALRTIQAQERSLLSLQSSLMRARIRLHTAMGGYVTAGVFEGNNNKKSIQ